MNRRAWLAVTVLGLGMAATGCSGKSVPSSVSVSQQKLQEMLARRFPRQFPVAGLLHLDLKAPQLSMIPERNMLNAVIPAELSGKVLKEQYSGLLISTALSALSFYTVERWAMRHRDQRADNRPGRQPSPRQDHALREATRGS